MTPCMVVYENEDGYHVPFVLCEDGSIEGWAAGDTVAIFPDRKSARRAIRISTARAKYDAACGKPANTDFTDGLRHIKVIPVAMVGGGK